MAAKRKFVYDWPRPAVTVDIALFTVAGILKNLRLRVLLIQRGEEPQRGSWALPGGFVRADEDLEAAALRELQEETGIGQVFLDQVGAVGTPGRDPRGHVVTVLYMGLVAGDRPLAFSGDAADARWFDVSAAPPGLPPLAFDHGELLQQALGHLRRQLDATPSICAELLPERFTLSEFQTLAQAIMGKKIDRRNFRRKIKEKELVSAVGGTRREGRHRPAQLYRFVRSQLDRLADRERSLPF
jgi:8-oxo-dGTP diphosphatase